MLQSLLLASSPASKLVVLHLNDYRFGFLGLNNQPLYHTKSIGLTHGLSHTPFGSTSTVGALVGSLPHMRRSLPLPLNLPSWSRTLRLRSNVLSSSSLAAHHLEPGRVNTRNRSGRRRGFDLSRSRRSPIVTVVGFLDRSRGSPSITVTVTVTVGLLALSGRCLPIITGL